MCDFFMKIRKILKEPGIKCYLFSTNKKLFTPEIMKLRVKMRDKNSPKIE